MYKTLIGVNILTSIQSQPYVNHMQFWYRLGRQYPEDQFFFMTPPRMSIDRMRNESAKIALDQECDYLMFIDDDVLVPITAYRDLVEMMTLGYDVAAGVVIIRGYPYDVMLFKEEYKNGRLGLPRFNDYKEHINDDGFSVNCGAVGFSCVLISVSLLKKIKPPYFVTGTRNTEDIYFCIKAKVQVPGVKIGATLKVNCGHLGVPSVYTPENRLLYKDLNEKEDPTLLSPYDSTNRSDEYIEKCLSSLELT